MPCLDDNTVLELVCGSLAGAEQARAQEHLDSCAACRALVADAAPDAEAAEWEHLQIGATLGRYRITGVLGAGAMGFVFSAIDPELDRTVALKLLRASGAEAAVLRPRLQREAQALARLSHPNVVAVHDVGTYGEHLFVALEWVDGSTLTEWLRESRSRLAITDAFRQAGEGLAAAHAAGLVHRDFKPDNVLVGKDGRVRVTDFGLALQIDDATPSATELPAAQPLRLTATGMVVGTPAYLAPEQLATGAADVRSDQFAFCVAVFEALHGHKPFAGDDWPALRAALDAGTIARRPGGPRVPRWLDRIVVRGLARDPARRWPTMRALLDAIARGPFVTPRRIGLALLALAAIAVLVVARASRADRHAREVACQRAGDAWSSVWSERSAIALRARLGDRGTEVAATVDRAFRAYGDAWSQMTRASCVATEVDGTQTRPVFAARDACLVERRDYAAELVGELTAGERSRVRSIDAALEVASSLPSIDQCANTQALLAMTPPHESLDQARRRADLQSRMARATIAGYLAADADPRPFATLAAEARTLGVPALEARARLMEAHASNDEQIEEAALQASALAALAAHDDAALADAWGRLAFHTGFHEGRFAESAQWAAYAQGALDRLGGDPVREAELLVSRGFALIFEGRAEDAQRAMARAHELFVAARGPDYWRIVVADYGEGGAALEIGKLDDALALYRRAKELAKRVAGVTSQAYVSATDNEGNALALLGRVDEALAIFAELDRTSETSSWRQTQIGAALRTTGQFAAALDHDQRATTLADAEKQAGPRAAYPPLGVGLDLLGLGRPAEARPLLERALGLREGHSPPDELAQARFALARALADLDPVRAHSLATSARELLAPLAAKYGSIFGDALREIDAWLQLHAPV